MAKQGTKTAAAMALVDAGMGPVQAAKDSGMSYVVLYRALKARADDRRPRCPACGGVVQPGQKVVAPPPSVADVPAAVGLIEASLPSLAPHQRQALRGRLIALAEGL